MALVLQPPSIRAWRRERVDVVYETNVFRVQKLAMRDGAGAERRAFFTFHCPDWVNVVPVTDDGHLILVWQYRFGVDALTLETPGGVMEPGEPPSATAARELVEETGYEAGTLEPLAAVQVNPALQNNKCHLFVARGCRRVRPQSPDPDEECEVTLVPLADVPALLDEGHVTHSLCVLSLERFLRKAAGTCADARAPGEL
jgi:8-oxo-dGTP pyrophosphatase MutT (NUDIX family)